MAESRSEILQMNLDEEASVLEICNEMSRGVDDHGKPEVRQWLIATLTEYARNGQIGFFIDEFGASDIREVEPEEGLALLQTEAVWSPDNEAMLHVYRIQD